MCWEAHIEYTQVCTENIFSIRGVRYMYYSDALCDLLSLRFYFAVYFNIESEWESEPTYVT